MSQFSKQPWEGLELTDARPAPRTDGFIRAEAEREYRSMPGGPLKRANIADYIAAYRKVDRHYCRNVSEK